MPSRPASPRSRTSRLCTCPGEYWYAGLPLVWAYGGQIAIKTGGKWVGDLTSPGSLAGLKEWETIQNFLSIPASRDVNTNAPDQDTVLAEGKPP